MAGRQVRSTAVDHALDSQRSFLLWPDSPPAAAAGAGLEETEADFDSEQMPLLQKTAGVAAARGPGSGGGRGWNSEAAETPGSGTLWSSAFNLTNTVLGAGILALPYSVSLLGYGLGVLLLLFAVIIADYSIHLLLTCSALCQRTSYEGLVDASLGRAGVILVAVAIIVLNVGSLTAYFIILGDVLPELVHELDSDFLAHSWAREWCTGLVGVAVLLPLSLLRTVTNLQFTSALSLACVLAFTLTIFIIAASDGPKREGANPSNIVAFRFGSDIFRSFSVLAFAFTTHTTLFPIYCELPAGPEPPKPTMMRATHLTMATCFMLYSIAAVSGYVRYEGTESGVQGDILLNLAETGGIVSSLVRLGYAVSIALTFPMGVAPIKQAVSAIAFATPSNPDGLHPSRWPLWLHVLVPVSTLAVTFVFGLYVPVLDFVFALTGALAGIPIVYIFPPIIFYKLSREHLSFRTHALPAATLLAGLVLGTCSVVYVVKDYVDNH